jgi:hypothetical protein
MTFPIVITMSVRSSRVAATRVVVAGMWGAPAAARAQDQTAQTSVPSESHAPPKGRALLPFLEGDRRVREQPRHTIYEANIVPHLIGKQTFGDVQQQDTADKDLKR